MWVKSKACEAAWVLCMFGWLIRFSQAQLPQFVLRSVSSSWSKGKWIHSNLQSSSTRRRLQTKDTERYREFSVKFVQFSSLLKFFPVCLFCLSSCQTYQISQVPRGPPSPPPPVHHSPPRKLTAKEMTSTESTDQRSDMTWQISCSFFVFLWKFSFNFQDRFLLSQHWTCTLAFSFHTSCQDQKDWKIPPCISNWKNAKVGWKKSGCTRTSFWCDIWCEVRCIACRLCLSSYRQLRQCSLSPGIHDPAGQALVSRWSKFAGAHLALNGI